LQSRGQTVRGWIPSFFEHQGALAAPVVTSFGGSPDMVMLIAAYLFDHPEYMYNPGENTMERSWSLSPVPKLQKK
jgi:hypothetical protein